MAVLIDKMLRTQIVTCAAVANWIFIPAMKVTLQYEYFSDYYTPKLPVVSGQHRQSINQSINQSLLEYFPAERNHEILRVGNPPRHHRQDGETRGEIGEGIGRGQNFEVP